MGNKEKAMKTAFSIAHILKMPQNYSYHCFAVDISKIS
jgi:hypothetical protein